MSIGNSDVEQMQAAERLLLSAAVVAKMLSISERKFYAMKSAGEVPAPILLGRCVRWRRTDIEHWISQIN